MKLKSGCRTARDMCGVAVCLAALLIAGCRAIPTIDGVGQEAWNSELVPVIPLPPPPFPHRFYWRPPQYDSYDPPTVQPMALDTSVGVGSATSRNGSSWGGRRQRDPEAWLSNICMRLADNELKRLAPCWHQSFQLMDNDVARLVNCDVALGLWGPDAIQMSRLATEDLNCIRTLRLSLEGVGLVRNTMIDATVRRPNGTMSRGRVSDRALAATAVRQVAEELAKLPPDTEALSVHFYTKPSGYENYLIGDRELEVAVSAALRAPSVTVLALQTGPVGQLDELFPKTWSRICGAIASMHKVRTLEFGIFRTNKAKPWQRWPFGGLDEVLNRHLAMHARRVKWWSVRRLTFMYFNKMWHHGKHILDANHVQQILGDVSYVQELAFFFKYANLRDAICAFLPLVLGYFDGAMGELVNRLLVHTGRHLTFLAQAEVDPTGTIKLVSEPQNDTDSVAVVHYLPAVNAMAEKTRNAMLQHLAVVLPRVKAATLQLPLQLCEGAGESEAECNAVRRQAAGHLREVLAKSQDLSRLKIDHFWAQPPVWLNERDVPWYAQALADAGPLWQLRVLSIRTSVSDAERGRHLEQILINNRRIRTLMLYLHDIILFSGSILSPDAEPVWRLNETEPCVFPDEHAERFVDDPYTCLHARYDPLRRALMQSQVQRIKVRLHLTHHVAGEVVSETVRAQRANVAAVFEHKLSSFLTEDMFAEVIPAFGHSALFWHERLPKSFLVESNLDPVFPTLDLGTRDAGWFVHQQADERTS